MTTTPRPTVQEELDAQFQRQVKRVADKLRDTAERMEREGSRMYSHQPRPNGHAPRHNMAVADVLNEFHSTIGNLPFWNLIAAADDAQREASK